jgi:hypothetical protein
VIATCMAVLVPPLPVSLVDDHDACAMGQDLCLAARSTPLRTLRVRVATKSTNTELALLLCVSCHTHRKFHVAHQARCSSVLGVFVQILQQTEGYEAFEMRRRAKFSKAIEGGAMPRNDGLDEGIDVELK